MFYTISKRILDIIVALVALTLLSPVLIIISILIVLESPGPVFVDINNRLGKNKKLFRMYKFRSMILGAHDWDKQLKLHPEWQPLYEKWLKIGKLPVNEDPRILKIGRFIRKTDLDEFSEFFNVLLGNMSVVGPRAMYPDELQRYLRQFPDVAKDAEDSLTVNPGITGVWQISGRNGVTIPQRFKMDAEYARARNVFKDIEVIIKTPIVMITRRGAYE